MRVDLYTKGVLTVIAGCLIYLSMGRPPVFQTAAAQTAAAAAQQAPPTSGYFSPKPQSGLELELERARAQLAQSNVLSGDKIGFRVERRMSGVVAGTWVVRIGDQWVPTEAMGRVVPLSH